MHTNFVIESLVNRAKPIPAYAIERRIGARALIGGAVSLVMLSVIFGVRTDLADAIKTSAFWMKTAYVAVILFTSMALLPDFARPETTPARWLALLTAPVLALAGLTAVELLNSPSEGWLALIMGMTSGKCSLRIAFFSLPGFIALMAAFRRFAPTQLAHAGATIGAASGAVGALVYTLYCREDAAGFLLVWYSLGILSMAALGASLGPLLLKWK